MGVGSPRAPRAERAPLDVGTIVWLASELMFFGALFAAYYSLAASNADWPPSSVHLDTGRALAFTFVLLVSSATVREAVRAGESGNTASARRWLAISAGLGAVFLANQLLEYGRLDFRISSHAYGSIYFLLTGFHALHVLGGIALLLLVASGPPRDPRADASRTRAASYYWHFVDIVWLLVFVTVFVVR